jgi:predicted RNase H-like nuclease (RuvC/YqgF family)
MSETLSTLSFAQRAKLIKNNAILNEDTCGSIAALQAEVLRLRSLVQNNLKSSTLAGLELNDSAMNLEDECMSSMKRKVRKAEQRASLLELEISEKHEVIQTLKRKLEEEVMVRKFKERRIEYFQKKYDGTYPFKPFIW